MTVSVYLADQNQLPEKLSRWFDEQGWQIDSRPQGDRQLVFKNERLVWHDRRFRIHPLEIDFLKNWSRLRLGKQDVFAKAIGVRLGVHHVVDATAGLGGDLVKLLKLGCEVTGIESSPILYALLLDAKVRAEQDESWQREVSSRFELRFGRAEEVLPQIPEKSREVIYLDPMFPHQEKSALAKGEMQLMQALLGEPQPVEPLLDVATSQAGRRVVLKRGRSSPVVHRPGSQVFLGKSVRYEVWLKAP